MRILRLGADDARWDDYVGPRSGAATDLSAWRRAVTDAYGLRSWALAAEDGGRLAGVLGLFEASHPAFGRWLTTAPFGNDGGFFFDGEAARDALLAEADVLAAETGADHLLLRTRGPELPGFQVDRRYSCAVLDLSVGKDAVWDSALDSKTRNQVRRGQKEGFTVAAGPEQLPDFHRVLHEHMRDLGSPSHSLRYYEAVRERLGGRAEFLVVRDGARLAAGALVLRSGGVSMNIHTVALRRYNPRCPNYLLYWRMIEDACARGDRAFDMGRSEADGRNMAFKRNWGAVPVPLYYQYRMRGGAEIPRLDPRDARWSIATSVWRMLPLAVTERIGPGLMRGLL